MDVCRNLHTTYLVTLYYATFDLTRKATGVRDQNHSRLTAANATHACAIHGDRRTAYWNRCPVSFCPLLGDCKLHWKLPWPHAATIKDIRFHTIPFVLTPTTTRCAAEHAQSQRPCQRSTSRTSHVYHGPEQYRRLTDIT